VICAFCGYLFVNLADGKFLFVLIKNALKSPQKVIMNFRNRSILPILVVIAVLSFSLSSMFAQVVKKNTARPAAAQRTVTVATEPNAIVWVDDVKRGVTDANGNLTAVRLSATSKVLRVRAGGFKESKTNLTAAMRGIVRIKLLVTGDQAELLFQKAEALREGTADDDQRQKAVDLYREALKTRLNFPEAHLGLARVYFDLKDTDNALIEVKQARKYRPVYPEASAVEGRIYHEDIDDENAIKAYTRAVKEGGGYQPEAHTGLGIIYKDQDKPDDAIREFKTAIGQLFDTEPVLYQLLGDLYERARNYKEAINTYQQYIKAAPKNKDVATIQSMIDQLKIEMAQDQPE
jgi:predicted negative regulator of RcsB-dependent stress response